MNERKELTSEEADKLRNKTGNVKTEKIITIAENKARWIVLGVALVMFALGRFSVLYR